MYIPRSFAETNLTTLHEFIERNSFGVLVSQAEGHPFATHLPFILDRMAGPNGTLIGHVARANPHWHHVTNQKVLAMFSGPHAYISPTWYDAENVVPTWNYLAVHVYGQVTLIEDSSLLLDIVQRSVSVYESSLPQPWSLDSSASYVKPLLDQIVGFRIEIAKIEGKFKLSQNHPVERREKVVAALHARGGEDAEAIASAMERTLPQ
ncbi:FMN-binding negative transcriptional regulator [Schlesneria paludicola]|uniref:FMN-binding negative transcriptional regulator n=1 Tax=Schlesneria paludicola TaxID=360056 RepID=UPI00029A33ED|nr:FMN-binding negative transcriptional regulator [Schlesneria paludicola]